MKKIDEIIYLLDCNRTIEENNRGIQLAKQLQYIGALVKPHNKNTWENCAKIIVQKSDQELTSIISSLFLWIRDADCPIIIFERLNSIKKDYVLFWCNQYLKDSLKLSDTSWTKKLIQIKNEYKKNSVKLNDIMCFLKNDNPLEIQNQGIMLAKNINEYDFIRKVISFNDSVWENGAKVIIQYSNGVICNYLHLLLSWLKKDKCPRIIFNRLKSISEGMELFEDSVIEDIEVAIKKAKKERDNAWLKKLYEIKQIFLPTNPYNIEQCFKVDIDYVITLLSWYNEEKDVNKGLKLAKDIKNLNCFIFPNAIINHIGYDHDVWENCALVLSQKSDDELEPYLYDLFCWIDNLNTFGAIFIYERLKKFKKSKKFIDIYKKCKKEAKLKGNESWIDVLEDFEL